MYLKNYVLPSSYLLAQVSLKLALLIFQEMALLNIFPVHPISYDWFLIISVTKVSNSKLHSLFTTSKFELKRTSKAVWATIATQNGQKTEKWNCKKCPINQLLTSYTHITLLKCSFQTNSSPQNSWLQYKTLLFYNQQEATCIISISWTTKIRWKGPIH